MSESYENIRDNSGIAAHEEKCLVGERRERVLSWLRGGEA